MYVKPQWNSNFLSILDHAIPKLQDSWDPIAHIFYLHLSKYTKSWVIMYLYKSERIILNILFWVLLSQDLLWWVMMYREESGCVMLKHYMSWYFMMCYNQSCCFIMGHVVLWGVMMLQDKLWYVMMSQDVSWRVMMCHVESLYV